MNPPDGKAAPGAADRHHTEGAQSINRAVAVLRIVAAHGRPGASLKDVAAASGLHKATTHRILRALADERLLEQDVGSRKFRLGLELYALGIRMGMQFDVKRLAQPSIDKLWRSSRETVYLGIRSGYDALCIDMREGASRERRLRLYTHDLWPLGVGSIGMTLLAHLPDWEVTEIVAENAERLARHPEYSRDKLLLKVAQTRQQGYAVDSTDASTGMRGIGVPVLDEHERPIAALCIVGAQARMDERDLAQLAQEMWVQSRAITKLWCDSIGD